MIRRILVGLGGTHFSDVAIQYAVEIAKRKEAALTGITVLDMKALERTGPVPLGGAAYAKELREKRVAVASQIIEEAIAKFTSACAQARIPFQVEEESGAPFERMITYSRYHDLIVFGLKSLFDYGIVEEPQDMLCRLISAGVRPIFAVPDHYRPIQRVLIAYSGSMESAKAMKRFLQFHIWSEVKLQLLCFGGNSGESEVLLAGARAYCLAYGLDPETVYHASAAKDLLLQQAKEWNADLIVMGNSVRSVLLKKMLGDVALNTIEHSWIPLFLSQ